MGADVFLTVAIPTYNRRDALEETVDSILGQVAFDERVELLISDNCSSDGTDELIRNKYLGTGKRITYIRRTENIGPDCNFLRTMEDASGHYVKFLNDNRPMLDGTLQRILSILEQERPAVLLTPNGTGHLPDSYRVTYCVDDFVVAASYFTTWLGAICLEKHLWDAVPDKGRGKGKFLIQTYFLFDVLVQRPHAVVANEPLFRAVSSPYATGGYNLFQVFFANYLALLKELVLRGMLGKRTYREERSRLLTHFMVPSLVRLIERPTEFRYDTRRWFSIAIKEYWLEPTFYLSPLMIGFKVARHRIRSLLHR